MREYRNRKVENKSVKTFIEIIATNNVLLISDKVGGSDSVGQCS